MNKWDNRFFSIAKHVETWSKDPSRKVGCVIVNDKSIISEGYNGLASGLSDDISRLLDRDWKLSCIIHAEVNAILNAAKHGSSTEGATIYTTYYPCSHCASAIIQAGIVRVVTPSPDLSHPRWGPRMNISRQILTEAKVEVKLIDEST